MEQKKEKIGFFRRLKKAIFELEDYGTFVCEKLTVAFKYFFLLILLVSIIITIFATYDFSKKISKVYNYIENELPDFIYSEGKLNFKDYIEGYDHDYKFRLIINTEENVLQENIKKYRNKIYSDGQGVLLLKDKLICVYSNSEIELKYIDILKEYNMDIQSQITDKEDLMLALNEIGKSSLIIVYAIVALLSLFITNVILVLSDVCVVAVFGWFAARICGVNFKMNPMIILAIYSLSLSLVLMAIYQCVYTITGFYIEYFNIIYLLIAYVYIIAAIFMVKYDIIKQTEELQKIIEVQKQVREEFDNKQQENDTENTKTNEENKKEDKETKEESLDENKEPDGSEI